MNVSSELRTTNIYGYLGRPCHDESDGDWRKSEKRSESDMPNYITLICSIFFSYKNISNLLNSSVSV